MSCRAAITTMVRSEPLFCYENVTNPRVKASTRRCWYADPNGALEASFPPTSKQLTLHP